MPYLLVQLLVPGQTRTSDSEHPLVPLPSLLPSIAGSGVGLSKIASKIGRSHAFVKKWNTCFELHGTVADQPRSGRPQKLSTEAAQQAMTATQDLDCKIASAIAVRAQQQSGVKMSLSTTTRNLRK